MNFVPGVDQAMIERALDAIIFTKRCRSALGLAGKREAQGTNQARYQNDAVLAQLNANDAIIFSGRGGEI